jgi:hypothetical protein
MFAMHSYSFAIPVYGRGKVLSTITKREETRPAGATAVRCPRCRGWSVE